MHEPVECSFYQELGNGLVRCRLCPHNCTIAEEKPASAKSAATSAGN